LSGTLWVMPLLFVVGALVLGSTLSRIVIEPGSPLDPVLFRGGAEEPKGSYWAWRPRSSACSRWSSV
jgi:hypothetical protein